MSMRDATVRRVLVATAPLLLWAAHFALMYLLAVRERWLPTSGMRTLGAPESTRDLLLHMVMPVMVLTRRLA